MSKTRCTWANPNNPLYIQYHDEEWGVPVHDDNKLFEMLILEGAQAGLSWETVLNKRAHYRKVFHGFDPIKVSKMTDDELEELLQDPGIIRNRLKVFGTRKNALAFLKIQKEFGTFDNYLWAFVDGKTIVNSFKELKDIPSKTELSDKISKNLKKRGMTFVGSTIIYAFMQATGMVNDHTTDCFRYNEF
jgi:DNA-3-methyladenine glycosylase I